MKKIPAFSLIEGVVSAVVLSIILTIAMVISFELYKSFGKWNVHRLQSVARYQLDSLVSEKNLESMQYFVNGCEVNYHVLPSLRFKNMSKGYITVIDSLGNEISLEKLFLNY